jgi:hypothetical protein
VGIESKFEARDALNFGSRVHQLLHEHRARLAGKPIASFAPCAEPLESEAQAAYAGYLAEYPREPFEVVEAEQTRVVPLPGGRHELVVKLDALVRNRYGTLQVLDTKTEGRSANSNDPESWAAKPQVALYVWAARQLYPREDVSGEIILDVIRRQSPKGVERASFRRDSPRRSDAQIADAVREITDTADRIEARRAAGGWYPGNRDNCKRGWQRCEYYNLHVFDEAREVVLARDYKAAEPYLEVTE